MSKVSSQASRVWMTRASPWRWASSIWRANASRWTGRGASGRSGSRGRTRRSPRPPVLAVDPARPGGRRTPARRQQASSESTPSTGVVGMEPDGGPQLDALGHRHRAGLAHGPHQGRPPRPTTSAPVPTQTIRVTPASEARAMVAARRVAWGPVASIRIGRVRLGELVLEVAVGVEPLDDGVVHRGPDQSLRRGKRGAPSPPAARPGTRPRPPAPGSRWSAGDPSSPIRRQIASAVEGMAGTIRIATMRRTSRALPEHGVDRRDRGRPSTARPARARRWSRGSAARWPRGPDGAGRRSRPPWPRPARWRPPRPAGCRAAGAGPTPPHLEPTTVVTRDSRLPEVVGQVGVVAAGDALGREVAVAAEGGVPQEVVADRVDAVLGGEVGRGDLVEAGLGHLLAAQQQPAVHLHVGRAGRCRRPCTWPATTRSGTG